MIKKKKTKRPFQPKKLGGKPSAPDLFDNTTKKYPVLGGKEKFKHDVELLMVEHAIKHPTISPWKFLTTVKCYSENQARTIFSMAPLAEWEEHKEHVRDKLTESVVKRHIDLIAEVQETHIKASKLGLAKALEMLTKMTMEPAKYKGKMLTDDKGKPYYKGFKSHDLLNVMSAIEKAQQIYRRAMGLPNEEAGLAQILDKLKTIQPVHNEQTVINNTINIQPEGAKKTEEESIVEKISDLKYDDVLVFIEQKRAMKTVEQIGQDSELGEEENA